MVLRVTGLIGRRVGAGVGHLHQLSFDQVGFHFIAADIGQHLAIDLNTRGKALPAPFYHLRAKQRIFDDIAIFVGQVVFAHDSANALTPAAGSFQVGSDRWCIH